MRFAFVTSRKLGKAVRRNKVRRRLRHAAWDLVSSGAKPHDVVVIARPCAAAASYATLYAELEMVLTRAGVLKPDRGAQR